MYQKCYCLNQLTRCVQETLLTEAARMSINHEQNSDTISAVFEIVIQLHYILC